MGLSVNYFTNLGAECYFSKLKYNESSFLKRNGCQYNLPYLILFEPCSL